MASELILASASPRRRELLAALGLPFEMQPPSSDERSEERDPVRLAEGLALRKARSVAGSEAAAGHVVIGADTIVVLEGRVLGKPADADEATAMLTSLRGRAHDVVTAVAVIAGQRVAADYVRTRVTMRSYTDAEIARYVATGSPFDKAGSYAIQDEEFAPVEHCDGCACSVIGLPLWTVRRLLRAAAAIEASEPAIGRCDTCPRREEPRPN